MRESCLHARPVIPRYSAVCTSGKAQRSTNSPKNKCLLWSQPILTSPLPEAGSELQLSSWQALSQPEMSF